MNTHDSDLKNGLARFDRRQVLRFGGGLAGAATLAGLARQAGAADQTTIEMDMACDGRTMRINRLDHSDPNVLPGAGDTFIVHGSLYPAGAIEQGLTGPDQPDTIGRWVCRGTIFADLATAEPGQLLVVTSVLHVLGDGISATKGRLESARDVIVTEGFEPEHGTDVIRTVLGGYGRYAGARGFVESGERGTNDTTIQFTPEVAVAAPNYTFTFTFTA